MDKEFSMSHNYTTSLGSDDSEEKVTLKQRRGCRGGRRSGKTQGHHGRRGRMLADGTPPTKSKAERNSPCRGQDEKDHESESDASADRRDASAVGRAALAKNCDAPTGDRDASDKSHGAPTNGGKLQDLFQRLIQDVSNKKYYVGEMNDICRIGTKLLTSHGNHFKVSMDTFKSVADQLRQMSREVDIQIFVRYLKVFRIVFLLVEDYDAAMRYLYGIEFQFDDSDMTLPMFYRFYEGFESDLGSVLQRITDADQLEDNLIREFAFMLTIAPCYVLFIIIMTFVHQFPGYDMFAVVEALRHISAFCELRVRQSSCESVGRSILTVLLYHFFIAHGRGDLSAFDFGDKEQRTRLAIVLQLFTTTRFRVSDGRAMRLPIFDPSDLLADFALSQFHPAAPRQTVNLRFAFELILKLLPARRVREGGVEFVERCAIRWCRRVADKPAVPSVSIDLFECYLKDVFETPNVEYAIKMETLSLLNYLNIVYEDLGLAELAELNLRGPIRRNFDDTV